ncbi:MAG: carbohydrate ABC transporter permease [Alphaproteobacteria bacterium]|tara:strand:+ start:794 stop:1714 length:921 start_codon:yes stop_codon:yes gene_type:complete
MAMTLSQKRQTFSVFRYAILTVWLCIVAFPMFWMVGTSFKPDREWFSWPPVYITENATLRNYAIVWANINEYTKADGAHIDPKTGELSQYTQSLQRPWVALRNSTIIAGLATTLAVIFGSVLAYGVSRHQILSESRMFQLLMLRMVPPIVLIAPISLWYRQIGLLDTITGLVILYFLTSLPYAVWMSKSFIDEVPREMEQAAEILGASRWRTIWEVVLPLVRSGLVATFLFILILTWSEYLLALLLSKAEVLTLPVELSKYQGSTEGRVYGRQAALSVGITIPLVFVGLIIRKHLARGFSFGMVRR